VSSTAAALADRRFCSHFCHITSRQISQPFYGAIRPVRHQLIQGASHVSFHPIRPRGTPGLGRCLPASSPEGAGDVATAIGTYKMALTPKKAGAKPLPTEEGKYLEVLKRQEDGSWKIIYDMWSPDAPPAKK